MSGRCSFHERDVAVEVVGVENARKARRAFPASLADGRADSWSGASEESFVVIDNDRYSVRVQSRSRCGKYNQVSLYGSIISAILQNTTKTGLAVILCKVLHRDFQSAECANLQRFQLKAVGFVYSHTVAAGQHCAVYLYFALYEEDVHAGVRLVQVIPQLLSGPDFSDGEPCLLQHPGRSIAVGRYDKRSLFLCK